MDRALRAAFNRAYTNELYDRYRKILDDGIGPFPFRVAETPLFLDRGLREHLRDASLEIVAQLSEPTRLGKMLRAIPEHYDHPNMPELPDCVQIDFALCREGERVVGRVVELQAFPSLSAMEIMEADAWAAVLRDVPGMSRLTCFFGSREHGMQLFRGCVLGPSGADETVLVDIEPETQKTAPDFRATKKLLGIDSICVSAIKKDGKNLLRDKNGRWVRIARIYNRLVFDELERKNIEPPWRWTDELDVTWCSHPNWYWVWSKFSMPLLDHPCMPKATYLSDLTSYPEDLESYVLKPLFSFAGAGVILDVTREALDAVPAERRHQYVIQRKIEYAPVIEAPDGAGVKAEVRMMMLRAGTGKPLEPLLPLVRLSRGKMLGVDQNRAAESMWTGGSVGLWPE